MFYTIFTFFLNDKKITRIEDEVKIKFILVENMRKINEKNIPFLVTGSVMILIVFFIIPQNPLNSLSENLDLPNKHNKVNLIVVAYFDTNHSDWNVLFQIIEKYPNVIWYVIINPCSGPCPDPLSDNWQKIISRLKDDKVKTLGYIFDTDQSTENIDYYMKNSKIKTDGIFFDNEGSKNNVENFKKYSNYVRSLGGIVFINPGYNFNHLDDYVEEEVADVINLYEFDVVHFNSIMVNYKESSSRFSTILGNFTEPDKMEETLTKLLAKGITTVYLYDHSYQQLPFFFEDLVQTVYKINKSN